MKLVYTADENDEYDFDYAVDYMDDNQEKMVEVITKIVAKVNPNIILDNIYVNHLKNDDGSTNLIKVVCVSYIIEDGKHLVCKAPLYAFNSKAWEYIEK